MRAGVRAGRQAGSRPSESGRMMTGWPFARAAPIRAASAVASGSRLIIAVASVMQSTIDTGRRSRSQ
jgi:hypothetical protein